MANKINWKVDFDINKQGLNQLKTSLQQINKIKISDVMKINNEDRTRAIDTLKSIKEQAIKVEKAFRQAFNVKLNTTNFETFKKSLHDSGTSIQQVYNTFSKGGVHGQIAFAKMANQVTNVNTKLKESHTWLDRMATTLSNTLKWNLASSAVNLLSRNIQQAWGFVKSLDTSLNDIRIVTGKSSEQMEKFSIKANDAAKNLGRTTVDYTNAALIYAQQGNGPKIFEAK